MGVEERDAVKQALLLATQAAPRALVIAEQKTDEDRSKMLSRILFALLVMVLIAFVLAEVRR